MTASMHKTLAALKLPTATPELLGVAEAILLAMTGHASFPSPTPPLAAVAAALAELRDAEVATLTRTRGTAAARNAKRAVLVALLMRLKAYVQGVADEDPQRAEALIQSAGLHVKERVAPTKPPFAVKPGAVSGSVRLVARSAGDRASYQWEWSEDAGATWRQAPRTLQARTVLAGLRGGTACAFRYRAVTKTGEGDWSEPVWTLVR